MHLLTAFFSHFAVRMAGDMHCTPHPQVSYPSYYATVADVDGCLLLNNNNNNNNNLICIAPVCAKKTSVALADRINYCD